MPLARQHLPRHGDLMADLGSYRTLLLALAVASSTGFDVVFERPDGPGLDWSTRVAP